MEIDVTESLLTALSTVTPIEVVSGQNKTDDDSSTPGQANGKSNGQVVQGVEQRVEQVNKLDRFQSTQVRLQDLLYSLSSMQAVQRTALQFSVDDASGLEVIRIIDRESGTFIRALSSEEALILSQKLDEIKGLLIDTQV
ncbi:flagellar protein FlaG [uncultured Shewanella sp.]|uniref:flagellar protein FlaG n=1 Tax=uncultured Shewanella sp. TaxID=173975 RepID=UPI00262A7EEF|nr:flagellar protein FlaG [uncultured Shewanella sp.]